MEQIVRSGGLRPPQHQSKNNSLIKYSLLAAEARDLRYERLKLRMLYPISTTSSLSPSTRNRTSRRANSMPYTFVGLS